MAKTAKQYKDLSIQEFTKAAARYEGDKAGIYEMCKEDYPDILAEIEKRDFDDLLDAGCGPAPMLSLLTEKYPDKRFVGLDLTPAMIETAKAKKLPNTEFVVGDCENLPFKPNSFDIIICSQSFHHYPNPQDFFNSCFRVLRPGGWLILRDNTAGTVTLWLGNHILLPLSNLFGHGDVRVYSLDKIREMGEKAGLKVLVNEHRGKMRLHSVMEKPKKNK